MMSWRMRRQTLSGEPGAPAARLVPTAFRAQVTVVSIGPKAAQETLRTALAMGADKGAYC